jgi:hypothetical protein
MKEKVFKTLTYCHKCKKMVQGNLLETKCCGKKMRYKYIELYSGNNSTQSLIDQINEKGQEGYRLVTSGSDATGVEWALMEKVIIEL